MVHPRGVAKVQRYTVTVSDPADAPNVTLTSQTSGTGAVAIGAKTVTGSKVTFEVKGTSQSSPKDDVTLTATLGNQTSTLKISVVIPKKFAKPHPTFNNAVRPVGQVYTQYTVPPVQITPEDKQEGIWCVVALSWTADISIKLNDQFDQSIDSLYDGAVVEESSGQGFYKINQNVSNGAYTDPVAVTKPAAPYRKTLPYPTKDWILQNTPPNENVDPARTANVETPLQDENAQVRVDGFELEPMVGRQAQVQKGNILKILWP